MADGYKHVTLKDTSRIRTRGLCLEAPVIPPGTIITMITNEQATL
jgi:hypothetical protein